MTILGTTSCRAPSPSSPKQRPCPVRRQALDQRPCDVWTCESPIKITLNGFLRYIRHRPFSCQVPDLDFTILNTKDWQPIFSPRSGRAEQQPAVDGYEDFFQGERAGKTSSLRGCEQRHRGTEKFPSAKPHRAPWPPSLRRMGRSSG